MVQSWCNRGHSWYAVDVTASIHGTELVWFRKVIPRGSCVHCSVEIHLADFFFFVFHQWWKNPPDFNIRTQPWPMTCKTVGHLVKWRQLLQCWCYWKKWPCDEDPLKWEKKFAEHQVCYYGSNEPTLTSQFEWSVNTFNDPGDVSIGQ